MTSELSESKWTSFSFNLLYKVQYSTMFHRSESGILWDSELYCLECWFFFSWMFLCFPAGLLFWFLVPVSSETNGTRGAPLVLQCHHNLSEKFIPEQTSIYWQSNSIVLHIFSKGQEEFQHQSESFKNRTAIFCDQLASGNFSLVINPLMLKDDQLSIEVAYIPESRTLCQTTVHVAGIVHLN